MTYSLKNKTHPRLNIKELTKKFNTLTDPGVEPGHRTGGLDQ